MRMLTRRPLLQAFVLLLLLGTGCKTQQDAAAAADQLAQTSSTLTAYYRALDHVLAANEDAVQAEAILNHFGKPDAAELDTLKETRRQVLLRASMARRLERLSTIFGALNKSSAPADAATEAGKLDAQLVDLKALSSNELVTTALTASVKLLVSLLQQHQEIKAARQMAPLAHNLSALFDSECDLYDSLNEAYLTLAESTAKLLVKTGQAEASGVFISSTRPFGLTPAIALPDTRDAMKPYLSAQIDRRYALALRNGKDATTGLSDALKEMSRRLDLLAGDKTMSLRSAPPTLDDVKAWIADVMQ